MNDAGKLKQIEKLVSEWVADEYADSVMALCDIMENLDIDADELNREARKRISEKGVS